MHRKMQFVEFVCVPVGLGCCGMSVCLTMEYHALRVKDGCEFLYNP